MTFSHKILVIDAGGHEWLIIVYEGRQRADRKREERVGVAYQSLRLVVKWTSENFLLIQLATAILPRTCSCAFDEAFSYTRSDDNDNDGLFSHAIIDCEA